MSPVVQILLLGVFAAGFASLLAPLSRRLGFATGAIDRPGGRKIHAGPVPRLGGTAVCGALVLVLGLGFATGWIAPEVFAPARGAWLLVGCGALSIVAIGVADDTLQLGAGPKLLVEALAAGLVVLGGTVVHEITNPFSGTAYPLGWLGVPVTIAWVIGITNAFNLIDGLDGLATGVGLIAAATLGLLALSAGRPDVAIVAVALAGALGGFLFFNFNPASIFLGDSGSLLLGYLLAVLAIESSQKGPTAVFVLTPILALGVPIMETALTVVRRFVVSLTAARAQAGVGLRRALAAGSASVMVADSDHIHHRLLALGLTHRRAVLLLYGICLVLNVAAVMTMRSTAADGALISLLVAAAMFFGVRRLGYRNLLLPNLELRRPHAMLALADGCCLVLAYVLAVAVAGDGGGAGGGLLRTAAAMSGAQVTLLIACGVYRPDAPSARAAGWPLVGTLALAVATAALVLRVVAGVGPALLSTVLLQLGFATLLLGGAREAAALRRRIIRARERDDAQAVRLTVASVPAAAARSKEGDRAA